MAVNPNQSGLKMLAVLEHIAREQPAGLRQLARSLDMDKSAVQRAIVTLAEAGWVQPAQATTGSWELTTRILRIAHLAHGDTTLGQRARPVLDSLRDVTGETAYLALLDADGLVVIEVAESRHSLRMVVPPGSNLIASARTSGADSIPFLSPTQQQQLLAGDTHSDTPGTRPGYVIGHPAEGDDVSITIAATVRDREQRVVGVLGLCGVRGRMTEEQRLRTANLISRKAHELSHSGASELSPEAIKRAIGGFG